MKAAAGDRAELDCPLNTAWNPATAEAAEEAEAATMVKVTAT